MYSASPLMVAGIGSSPPDKDKLKRIDRLMDGCIRKKSGHTPCKSADPFLCILLANFISRSLFKLL